MNTVPVRILATVAAFMLSGASIGAIITVPPASAAATAAPMLA